MVSYEGILRKLKTKVNKCHLAYLGSDRTDCIIWVSSTLSMLKSWLKLIDLAWDENFKLE